MKKIVRIIILLVLFSLNNFGQPKSEITNLPLNKTFERQMSGEETHRYQINLKEGEFLQIKVEQKGVDVMLRLLDNKNNVLATMDSPNEKQDSEILSFIAPTSAAYLLEIKCSDAKAEKGTYSFLATRRFPSSDSDKERVEVERIFVEGMTARETEGQLDLAIKKLEGALEGWRKLKDEYLAQITLRQINQLKKAKADFLFNEGVSLFRQQKVESYKNALEKFQSARNFYEEKEKGFSFLFSGLISDKLGMKKESLRFYEFALKVFRLNNDKAGEGVALNNLGKAYSDLGDNRKAIEYYEKSLSLSKDIKDKAGEATTLNNLGGVYSNLGDNRKAIEYYEKSLDLLKEVEDIVGEAKTLNNLGKAYLDLENNQKAIEYYEKSLDLLKEVGDNRRS